MHTNDVAQAQLFEAILLVEMAEANHLADSAERRWLKRCERGIDDGHRVPEALVRLRGRVAEVEKLLDALAARFPQR
jgi:hypothetical protein